MWLLDSALPRTEPLSSHVTHLLAQLPDDRVLWAGLKQKYTTDIYCSLDVRVPNSGTELTATAIEALAALGLSVQFDFYALLAEEEDDAAP